MPTAIPTSKPKTVFYKMVTVPKVSKTGGVAASSYSAFTTAFNRIGATLNSTIVINNQIRDSLLKNLKMKSKELEDEKKQFQKEKADKNKKGSGGLTKLASNVTKVIAPVIGSFFEGLMELGGFLMRAVITQSVLRWIANPANQEKLAKIWEGIVGVFNFLKTFITDNITKTLDGLASMLDSNLGFWDRLKGFGTFIAGFGSLLLGFTFLKNPKLLLSGVKFVLQTIWKSVSQASKLIRSRRSGGGRGRAGKLLGAAALGTAAVTAASMGQGESSQPFLKDGGVATRPTPAVMGERGPEVKIPLDNKKRIRDAGIKPLSSLGGDNKPDQAKAKNLSDLYMAPFKGIGAGIIGTISNVVGQVGGPASKLTPILSDIITPVANSFGVPPSLVKKLSGQVKSTELQKDKTKKSGTSVEKLFGKGKASKTSEKKFTRKGDNTVLGLLTDILFASQVIANKVGGGSNQTTNEQLQQSDPGSPDLGSKTTITASGQAGDGRQSQVAGTKEGIGISDADRNRQTNQLEQNSIHFTHDNKKYKVLINPNSGQYELWKSIDPFGITYTEQVSIGGPNGPKKGGLNELLLRKAHNEVQSFFVKNAPQKGLALKYINQTMIDAHKKAKDKKANGGWISGPMSGYPVSLDGGMSTSFIGHGTEWVGFKKAAGGASDSAFVIPFDTPATKNNKGLTSSRFRQAKSGGYALPQYAKGGKTDRLFDDGKLVKSTAPGRASGGIVSAAKKAVTEGKRGPATPPCASWVRMVLGMAGHPAANKTTKLSDLDSEKGYNGLNFAGSFAGSDMGKVINSQSELQPGDIVLHKNTYGNFKPGSVTHVSIASEKKGKIYHQPTSGRSPNETSIWNFKAGIRLGETGSTPGGTTDTTTTGGTEDEMAGITGLADTFDKLNVALGLQPAPSTSPTVASASTAVEAEKDKLKSQTKASATAAVAGAAAVASGAMKQQNQSQTKIQSAPAKPIILPAPGPSRNLPIEALNSTTSLIQYSWKFA